jgi:predicted RNase H-like HicB family nuclease
MEGPLQEHLVNLGKRVWGSRRGEELELFRAESKEHLKDIGVDIGPYKVVRGLDKLREYLKENEEQYVKISRTRGDMETFFSRDYRLIEPKLDELEAKLGAKKHVMEFLVEKKIECIAEVGYDGFCIDGTFPKNAMFGIEIKDESLVMRTMPYDAFPDEVRSINDKMAPTLKRYGYRNFISSEIRIAKDKTPYAIDPCCRAGSPPSEIFWMMVSNWPDILWEGADGTLVEPKFTAKWAAELLLLSSFADQHWQPIDFPNSIRDHIKLRNLTKINGRYYVVPQEVGLPEIGAVVATGNTMQEAIANVRKISEKVEGHYIEVRGESLDKAAEQFETLRDAGIKV